MKVFGNHRPLIIDAAKLSGVASLWSGWDTKTYVFYAPASPGTSAPCALVLSYNGALSTHRAVAVSATRSRMSLSQ